MVKNNYENFIQSKRATMPPTGFSIEREYIHASLFDFQKAFDDRLVQ